MTHGRRSLESHVRLMREWHPIKNSPTTPTNLSSGSGRRIWWRCSKRKAHEWEAPVFKRVAGQGCPYCSGRRPSPDHCLAVSDPRLTNEWHSTKNGKLTPYDFTPNSGKKVWWKCAVSSDHEWQASIDNRVKGRGCPCCRGLKAVPSNCLAMIEPNLAKQCHPKKNKIAPHEVTPGSNKIVWWLCSSNHEWHAKVADRAKGRGCPFCSGRRPTRDNNLEVKKPMLAEEWHPTKNGKLKPDQVTPKSGRKVYWLCRNDHTFMATIYERNQGIGCQQCKSLTFLHPRLIEEWHSTKNMPLTVKEVSAGSGKRVWWKCSKGHEWQARVQYRSRGSDCIYCTNQAVNDDNSLAQLNPLLARQWHPAKNEDLTPKHFTKKSGKRVWWICPRGHEWQAAISDRANGTGCPKCNVATSQSELRIYSELKHLFPDCKHKEKLNGVESDIFIPNLNLSIEVDGWYWHKSRRAYRKDKHKSDLFLTEKISHFRVREAGLRTITTNDVHNESSHKVTFGVLEKIVKRIILLCRPAKASKKRMAIYLKERRFQNEELYLKLWSSLPSPSAERSLAIVAPKIAKQWHPIRNGSLTPSDVTHGSEKDIWWICKNGHEWQARILNRYFGNQGCPFCSGQRLSRERSLEIVNPKVASEWHSTKNEELRPNEVFSNSGKNIWWKCGSGHEWQARVADRNKGKDCPYCRNRRVTLDNSLASRFPNIANEWHPQKNGQLRSIDLVFGSNKKVWWRCSKGHEWLASPNNRVQGSGCGLCANNRRFTIQDIKKWAMEHQLRVVSNKYKNANSILTWQCTNGHTWKDKMRNVKYANKRCPKCVAEPTLYPGR